MPEQLRQHDGTCTAAQIGRTGRASIVLWDRRGERCRDQRAGSRPVICDGRRVVKVYELLDLPSVGFGGLVAICRYVVVILWREPRPRLRGFGRGDSCRCRVANPRPAGRRGSRSVSRSTWGAGSTTAADCAYAQGAGREKCDQSNLVWSGVDPRGRSRRAAVSLPRRTGRRPSGRMWLRLRPRPRARSAGDRWMQA
jgi:hypothetical protein